MEKAIVTFLNPDTNDKVVLDFKFDREKDFLDVEPTFHIKHVKTEDNALIKMLSSAFMDMLNKNSTNE